MIEAELRRRFDREVGALNKELLWEHLKRRKTVADTVRGEFNWEDFKEEADALALFQRETLGRASPPPGRTARVVPVEVELRDEEEAHAAALAPYLAKHAALLPEVRRFREEKPGGGPLRWEENPYRIVEFLRREVEVVRRPKDYVDTFDALDYLDPYEKEDLKDYVTGGAVRWRLFPSTYRAYQEKETALVEAAFEDALEADSASVVPEDVDFRYGAMDHVYDAEGKSLGDLAHRLASLYPWEAEDAAWFVLTEEPPEVVPLSLSYDERRGDYALVFAPWVSEETYRGAYRSVHGRDNRPLGKKALALFSFVTERTGIGEKKPWAELTRAWNEVHGKSPAWRFEDRSELRRMYLRAERKLAAPWIP